MDAKMATKKEVIVINRWAPAVIIGISLFVGMAIVGYSGTAKSAEKEADNIHGQSAIQKMAVIMHRLKHFPSPQGKQTLQHIIADKATTEREKDLATAILNLNHRASLEDKTKLKKIMNNDKASPDERDLASIIYSLDHRPTKADIQRLKEMMQ